VSARPNAADATTGKPWVAVEGPCCAGKTTLSRGLLSELTDLTISHVRCYADHVGGGRYLPRPVPESLPEDRDAVGALLTIEADRVASARAEPGDLALMDRSVYTLLAHRYALQRVTGMPCFAPAERVIARSEAPAWPDLVLYLDVTQQAILDRNRRKFPPDSIFINTEFNAGIRAYFTDTTDREDTPVVWLDATLDPAKLLKIAEVHIRELLLARES
jgi:thymidylate kinase